MYQQLSSTTKPGYHGIGNRNAENKSTFYQFVFLQFRLFWVTFYNRSTKTYLPIIINFYILAA